MSHRFQALSVDDDESNLLLIETMAQGIDLEVHSFISPTEALENIESRQWDLAFVDYQMPGMNGIELIQKLRPLYPEIPIIMITGIDAITDLKIEAIEAGATEFLSKPLNMPEFRARVHNLMELRMISVLLKDRAKFLKNEVSVATQEIVKRENESLEVLGRVADYKDLETGNHVNRVAAYAQLLAHLMGASPHFQDLIYKAAPLHDIGKVGIPDAILGKRGRLNSEELKIMKLHPQIGYNILMKSESPYLKCGAIISLSHHERFDGSGYPEGLKGEDIPLEGRIIAISDVFDALLSKRPYKSSWPLEEVKGYFEANKGRHFDPVLVDHLLKHFDAFVKS